MMPRKKRIAIIVVSIILIITIILFLLLFMYLKTDIFKTKEELFIKYSSQNLNMLEILKNEDVLGIKDKLDTNKYTSQLIGKIEYTENIGTSDENKDSTINNVGIKINSSIDKQNEYDYKDITIGTDTDDLVKLEYLKQNENCGIRLNGIKQFVSTNTEEIQIEKILSEIDFDTIFNFTEQEKQNLLKTYMQILQSNISKDKYYKQSNALITVNNKDIQTNAYYIKITVEEFNNLYIKVLEQIENEEIILSKIDLIEDTIKEKYSNYENEESLRNIFINNINEKIDEIQSNNIGNEEVKITVYENEGKTVRTSIEKTDSKITIDLYNKSGIKIDQITMGENVNEKFIKVEKNNSETQNDLLIEYEEIQDNEIINNIQINYEESLKDSQIIKNIELGISNEKYESILNIENNIKIQEQFENQITLETDNIKLQDLNEEQANTIKNILSENIQEQLINLNNTVGLENYIKMLQNLKIIKQNSVEIPNSEEVTDIERKRFNSQFEFFESENLTADNIKELMQIVQNNFNDMKVVLKTGEVEDLNLDLLNSNGEETNNYKKNISEIVISIKQNSQNEDKLNDMTEYLEIGKNYKYTVSLQYDDNGLVDMVRIKVQEN